MPIVSYMPEMRLDRSKPEEFIVNTSDISQGNIEYQVERAKNITTGMQSQDTWSGMDTRTGMHRMGTELQDSSIAKDDAWWQKALGVLEPLKYLEIPIELAAEAVFDPVSWATGRDLSWVRGTAEREQFEAWKALGRDDPNETGWGEVFSRADKAFDAFDKRPMAAQLALAGVQIAATGGTSLALKAASLTGKGARTIAMARAARTAAFVLDPWEIGWHGARFGVKGARYITKTRTAADGTYAGVNTAFEQQVAGVQRPTRPVQDFWEFDETGQLIEKTPVPTVPRILDPATGTTSKTQVVVLDEKGIPVPLPNDASHSAAQATFPRQIDVMKNTPAQALANQFWTTYQPRYDINGNGVVGTVMAGDGPISPHVFFKGAEESGRLSPILESGNTIRRFVHDRYQEAMAAPSGSYERVEALREMAVTQMNLSMGSRHGQTFTATKDAIWGADNSFLETNLLRYHDEANGNTAGLWALDQGEAYTAIRMYKEALEEWGRRSGMASDWIDDNDQIFSFRVDKDGNGVFDQSLDVLEEVDEKVADIAGKSKKTGKKVKVVKKRGNKETDSDIGFSGNLNEILKKYRLGTDEQGSLLYPQYQNMPTSAKDFRSHRATEMHLEGKSSSYIQQLLNHAENSTTISYIRDVGSIGAGTLPFQVLTKASHTVSILTDMESTFGPALQDATKQLQAAIKENEALKRAKGGTPGGFESDVQAIKLGEAMMYSDEGSKMLEEYLPDYAHDLVGKGEDAVFKPAGVSPEQVGREVQMLLAMTRLADEIGTAAEYARDIGPAVYKNINRSQYEKIGIHGGSLQTPGILNRAGYYTEGTGRNKVIKWAGDIKFKGKNGANLTRDNRAAWTKRRNDYGKEAQIYEDIDWDEWAAAQYSKVQEAEDLWNGLRMPAGFNKDGSVKYSKYRVHSLIGEYVDMKAWELLYQWDEIPIAQKSHLSRDIDGILQSLVSGGMGPSMKNMSTGQYKKVGAHIFAELDRVKWAVRSADEINGLWREKRGGQYTRVERGPAVDEAVEKVSRMPIQDIEAWLHNPDVISTLGIHRIDASTTPTKMKEKFRTIAAKAPRVFGEDFAKFSQKGKTKEEILNSGVKANHFLDMLADRLLNNKHLMEHLTANAKREFATINERVASIQQGRMRSLDAGVSADRMGELGFVNPHSLVHRVTSHQHQTERILESRDSAMQQWLNKKDNIFMQSIKAIYKVGYQAATGGMAGIAHPLTRGLSGRAQAYDEVDTVSKNVGLVVHSVATKMLGLSSSEPRRAQKLLGIRKGHEFFGDAQDYRKNSIYGPQPEPQGGRGYTASKGLELQDFDDIMKWEKNEGYKHYHEYAKNNNNGAALHRLMTEMADDQDMAMKYLTQVDMVLERIAPEHWDKYFKLTDDQRHALVYIKDMQFQVDEFARQRGLNIPGAIQDKGSSYLIRYFPRLYQQENLRRLSDKSSKDSMLTSGGGATNSVFQGRDDTLSDIVDVLGYGAGMKQSLGETELTAAKYMLDDIGTRMQVYSEVIHKEVIDQDTVKWLENQPEFKAAAASQNAREAEYKALSAMETLVNKTNDSVAKEIREHGQLSAAEKLNYQWKHQILNNDDILKMNAFYTEGGAWDLPFGQSMITRIASPLPRDAAWVRENFDEISGFVAERKAVLEETHASLRERRFREKTKDDAWLTKTLNTLDPRQRDAVTQHLVAAGTFWGDPLRWTANILKRPTETLRYFKSGLDLGAPMIHGFNALVRLPVGREGFDMKSQQAWLDGVKMMGKFFAQPEMYDQWVIDNMDKVGDARQYVRLGNPEPLYVADSDAMRNARAWVSDQGFAQNKHMKLLSRFEAGFTGYLDVMRVNLWDSMKSVVDSELRTTGKNLSQDALDQLRRKKYHELGAVINKMTGAFDPHLAQQTPFQSLIENSLLFFAPMYRRATFGIMADIGRGNQRSEQAIRTLGGVLVAGMMMQQLAVMTGNSSGDMFDPEGEKGKGEGALDLTHSFGKIKVGGMQMGIGTAWWTVFRMASDVAMMSYHDDDVDLDRDSWADNPVMEMLGRRGRSQLAPGTALLTDLITGRNFIGEPLRDADENNWAAMGQHAGKSAIPFWLDGALSGGSVTGGMLGMTAEFLGLQSYEISSYDRLSSVRHQMVNTWMDEDVREWRDEQHRKGEPINYISMPSILKAKLNTQNPEVRMLLEEHNENYGAVARGAGKIFYEYNQKKRNHDNEINKTLATVSRQVETGTKSYQDLQNAISNAKFAKRHFNNALLEEYPELSQHFHDLRIGRATSDLVFQGDIVYDQWANMRNSEEFIDIEGIFNYEAMLSEEADFWANPLNADHKEYVEEKHRKWTEHLPTVRKFEEAKDYLQRNNYWNMHDLIWTPGSMMHAKARLYLKRPRVHREAMKKTDSTYVTIEKALQRKRQEVLTKDPYMDEILVTYYGNNPVHPRNQGLKERLIRATLGAQPITPRQDRWTVSPAGITTIVEEQLTGV